MIAALGVALLALGLWLAYLAGIDRPTRKARAHADQIVDAGSRGRHPSRLEARR